MSLLKNQLLTAVIDSFIVSGLLGFLGGVNFAHGNYLIAAIVLLSSFLNAKNAEIRYQLYKKQK